MIFINIGSNLSSEGGGRKYNINKAINYLKDLNVNLISLSNFYETPSYPDKSKPKFINICIKLKTELNPTDLLTELQIIEKKIGRTRLNKNEPRVCDIDIIDYDGKIIDEENLKIPHPRLHLRNFVIYPLREIEPEWIHPIFNKKIDNFFKELSKNSHNEITRLSKSDILI
tara:strand:+ start:385 stop:897 length:513 start_codon:yes stop_codon:yes gene_type:complete